MYAIVEQGNQQYKVASGSEFEVERLKAKKGDKVELDKVLLVSDGKEVRIGNPYLKSTKVVCEVLSHFRAKKVIAFKYRRRKGFKCKIGHRQELSKLKVKKIQHR